jgi:hypothetical protein
MFHEEHGRLLVGTQHDGVSVRVLVQVWVA